MELDLENPLMMSSHEVQQDCRASSELFSVESHHIISPTGAIHLSARRDAVSLVLQAQFDCNLDPFVAYLAINYIHRFLCKREIPREKPWIVRLLSIACLSLASKMKNAGFAISEFQREKGFVFDAITIRRMEILVLGALDWRMRSITPFSFLQFFISFFAPAQPHQLRSLRAHATQILLKAQTEIESIEFRPSAVAASALLAAAYEFFPVQFPAFRAAVSSCEFVNEDELRECISAMGDGHERTARVSTSDTPRTVLGRRCSSSESEFTAGSSRRPGACDDGSDVKTAEESSEKELKRRGRLDSENEKKITKRRITSGARE